MLNNIPKQIKFAIVVALQILVLLIIIVFKFSVISGGADVFLKIMPVDPRDPLRGDYVTFRYNISQIEGHYFNYSPVKNGDKIYVSLDSGRYDRYWGVSGMVEKNKPSKGVFLKGVVESEGVDSFEIESNRFRPNMISIKYGIEEYFIPEGTGWNQRFGGDNNYAKVAVDENGNAVIKQLYIDDKPWP